MKYLSKIEFLKAFGRNLQYQRKLKGLTQEQLANDLGIEISQISRIERGVINTSLTNVYMLSNILEIDANLLFKTP